MYMKWFLKNKKSSIQFLIFCIMIYLFAILGTKEYQVEVEDNIRFATEYKDITKNNLYVYTNEQQILEIINGKSGVIFMAFPSNIWSHYYADYLNEVAINNKLEKIYYYDFLKDRKLNNKTYNQIVTKLQNYLVSDDLGNMDLVAPTVIVVKNGKVLYFDEEIQFLKGGTKPQDYFTEERKNVVKEKFDFAIKELVKEEEL